MDFLKLAEARHSVRAYRSDPLSDALVSIVLEAARLAPTACNLQPFQLHLLATKGREEELLRIYPKGWFVQAPLVVGICALTEKSWKRRDGANYATVDAAIAFDHLILAATSLGLGTCWVAAFDPVAAREILQLPEGVEPVAFTPLGWPAEAPPPEKKRKPLDALVIPTSDAPRIK
jgi:nitroreductase